MHTPEEILRPLTDAQREAVQHVDGPLLMLAGPGSGKTRVVTHRVAYLISQGVSPREILALTFTNKAADEMQQRLARIAPDKPVWMGTFHRFCARLLRSHAHLVGLAENYTIYDTDDSRKALKRALSDIPELELSHFSPDAILHGISWAKNRLITADKYVASSGNALGSIVARVYPHYQRHLFSSNAVDFDDMLLHVANLLRENSELRSDLDARFRYVLVDEYQDTNLAQYAIVRALAIDHPNLAVTGDPDQSIYGWRGASISNILGFEKDYPNVKVVRLEQNYRSSKAILRVADQLIGNNRRRKEKLLYTENKEGLPVRLAAYQDQRVEADSIAERIRAEIESGRRRARDFAIFYRVNALSRSLEVALREQGLPYQIINGVEFFQRKEIRDILAYIKLLNNPRDNGAFERIINSPRRGIGNTTIERLRDHARRYHLTMLEASRECGLIESLAKRSAVMVAKFVAMFDRLCEFVHQPVEELLGHVLTESTYAEVLEASGTEEDQQRLANIEELLTVAREFDLDNPDEGGLEQFLEQTSLVNDTDQWEEEDDKVTMMTLHGAKGLEFPCVFIIAMEEGLIPHARSKDDASQLEEERRLLFVGITRAEEELELSRAKRRDFRGERRMTVGSSFLMELPRDEMEVVGIGGYELDDDFPSGPVWEDDEFIQDDSTSEDGVDEPEIAPPRLMTAAEMMAESKPAVSPDDFSRGMVVTHPEYGIGKVVALSGVDSKRMATVQFVLSGQKKFRLAKSPLTPVRLPE